MLPRPVLTPWVDYLSSTGPWLRVTKSGYILTLHSSLADLIPSAGFNYHMPMIAKFVFQANSSLLKSEHILQINDYLNLGILQALQFQHVYI